MNGEKSVSGHNVSRRRFLSSALGAAAGVGSASLLGACTGNSGPSGPGPVSDSVKLPVYVGYDGLKPDLPGLPNGTAPYYRVAPAVDDRPAFWEGDPPGKGGTFTVLTFLNKVPVKVEDNQWWQALNKAVNADIRINGAAVGDYPSKFQVAVAGDDLPDACVLYPERMNSLGPILKAKFQDLTEYLSGDNIKDYPGLANLPSYCWEATVFNGGIYTVPIQRLALRTGDVVRADLIEGDASPTPTNGAELLALLKGLSNLRKNQWATVYAWGLLARFNEMMGTPNLWREEGGRFVKDYETETFPEALNQVQQCWANNYIHPIAFQPNYSTQADALMESKRVGYVTSEYSANFGALMTKIKTEWGGDPVWFPPTKWEGGGQPKRWVGTGAPYMTAIRKAKPERIREILSIMDWFSSPWMTQEYTLARQGLRDVDYTVEPDGTTKPTPKGEAEVMTPLIYVGSAPTVHYSRLGPEFAKVEYEAENLGMQNAQTSPTVGLESPTDQKEGVKLDTKIQQIQSDIIQGRKPVSAWADAVKAWRAEGGDKIRAEYEQAFAAKND